MNNQVPNTDPSKEDEYEILEWVDDDGNPIATVIKNGEVLFESYQASGKEDCEKAIVGMKKPPAPGSVWCDVHGHFSSICAQRRK